MLMSLQHDTGRWGTEHTWQAESGGSIFGLRVLRNFGRLANGNGNGHGGEVAGSGTPGGDEQSARRTTPKRVDEEDAMEGGLKGRLSAGAEFYVSTEKSAGGKLFNPCIKLRVHTDWFSLTVSAGVRFTTLPNSALQSHSSSSSPSPSSSSSSSPASSSRTPILWQPPTICTATFSPITGHLTAAYSSKVSRDVALCSRFTFNINSYESEWTMGGEWWLRKKPQPPQPLEPLVGVGSDSVTKETESLPLSGPSPSPETFTLSESTESSLSQETGQVQGVVKARISTSSVRRISFKHDFRPLLSYPAFHFRSIPDRTSHSCGKAA